MTDSTGRQAKGDPPYVVVAPEVARLAAEGLSRNAIARQLGRAPSTVSRAAMHAGVEFSTEGTESATRAAAEQAAGRRAELAHLTAEIALTAGRRLHIEVGAEVLDPATVKALSVAMGISVDKALMLAATLPEHAPDDGLSVAHRFMEAMETDALEHCYWPDDRAEEESATGQLQPEHHSQLLVRESS